MKIKRTLAIAAVALLLVGGTAATTLRSFAQTTQPPAQVQTATAADDEKAVGADTDQIEEQVGDQSAADTGAEAAEAPEGAEGQDPTPAGTPAITADQARAAAEAHLNAGTATKVQLDDENGKLVYSVEIGTSDVKVDAMTGAVLGVDSDGVDGGPDYQG